MKVLDLPIELIVAKKNIRVDGEDDLGELMTSIEHHDLLQPVVVIRHSDRYHLVFGHRRLAAMKLRGESRIAAHILDDVSASELPLIALEENITHKPLSSEEIVAAADAIKASRRGISDSAISRMLGKNPSYLAIHRSNLRAATCLARSGIDTKPLTMQEIRDTRAKLNRGDRPKATRSSKFHRGADIPSRAFRIETPRGPSIMVICASPKVKDLVVHRLEQLQQEVEP